LPQRAGQPSHPPDATAAHHERGGDVVGREAIKKPPQPRAHAIVEDVLLHEIAHARHRTRLHLAVGLGVGVALFDRELGAFLEIDHERNREPRAVRPDDGGALTAIAAQVALEVHGHRSLIWRVTPPKASAPIRPISVTMTITPDTAATRTSRLPSRMAQSL